MATHKRKTVRMEYEDALAVHEALLAERLPGGHAYELEDQTGRPAFELLFEKRKRRLAARLQVPVLDTTRDDNEVI